MNADISFQRVMKISAGTYSEVESTPFFLTFESSDNSDDIPNCYSHGRLCLHLEDKALALALVEAINRVVADHEAAKQPTLEAA